jgi:hypothetical protein
LCVIDTPLAHRHPKTQGKKSGGTNDMGFPMFFVRKKIDMQKPEGAWLLGLLCAHLPARSKQNVSGIKV